MYPRRMNDERLIELETRLSYLDDTVQVLNEVITAQNARIDKLEAWCRALAERARRQDDGGGAATGDERPPHY